MVWKTVAERSQNEKPAQGKEQQKSCEVKRYSPILAVFAGLVMAALAIYFIYGYVYVPVRLYFVRNEQDALTAFGFWARLYNGDETSGPGIVLSIPYNWVPDAAVFEAKKPFANVIAISAQGQWMSREILRSMSAMPRLQKLWLDGQPVGDEDLQAFAENTRLKVLGLFRTEITTNSLRTIAGLTDLEELDLGDVHVDAHALGALCRNKELMNLRLWGIDVEDKDLENLIFFKKMKSLELASTKITSSSVSTLLKFQNLEKLKNELRLIEGTGNESIARVTTTANN